MWCTRQVTCGGVLCASTLMSVPIDSSLIAVSDGSRDVTVYDAESGNVVCICPALPPCSSHYLADRKSRAGCSTQPRSTHWPGRLTPNMLPGRSCACVDAWALILLDHSGSLDTNIYIWSVEKPTKRIAIKGSRAVLLSNHRASRPAPQLPTLLPPSSASSGCRRPPCCRPVRMAVCASGRSPRSKRTALITCAFSCSVVGQTIAHQRATMSN